MNKKNKSSWNAGTLIAVGVAIGAGLFPAKEDENKWGRNPLLER